jgi:hypothetical protein
MKQNLFTLYRGGDVNSVWNIWALPVLAGMGPPRIVMTYMSSDAPWHKEQEHIHSLGVETSTRLKI